MVFLNNDYKYKFCMKILETTTYINLRNADRGRTEKGAHLETEEGA